MKVKVRRRKTAQEAWADFVKHYMPKEPGSLIDPTGTPLMPSHQVKDCLGSGENPSIRMAWAAALMPEANHA